MAESAVSLLVALLVVLEVAIALAHEAARDARDRSAAVMADDDGAGASSTSIAVALEPLLFEELSALLLGPAVVAVLALEPLLPDLVTFVCLCSSTSMAFVANCPLSVFL